MLNVRLAITCSLLGNINIPTWRTLHAQLFLKLFSSLMSHGCLTALKEKVRATGWLATVIISRSSMCRLTRVVVTYQHEDSRDNDTERNSKRD